MTSILKTIEDTFEERDDIVVAGVLERKGKFKTSYTSGRHHCLRFYIAPNVGLFIGDNNVVPIGFNNAMELQQFVDSIVPELERNMEDRVRYDTRDRTISEGVLDFRETIPSEEISEVGFPTESFNLFQNYWLNRYVPIDAHGKIARTLARLTRRETITPEYSRCIQIMAFPNVEAAEKGMKGKISWDKREKERDPNWPVYTPLEHKLCYQPC